MSYIAALIEWSQQAVANMGLLGVFLVSFIGSATVILPAPIFLAIFAAGSVLNPWLVGLVGGLGAAFGALTAYYVGMGGKRLVKKDEHKKFFVASLIGKIILTTALAWAGFYGMEAVLQIFEGGDLPILLLTVAGAAAIFLVFKLLEKRGKKKFILSSEKKSDKDKK